MVGLLLAGIFSGLTYATGERRARAGLWWVAAVAAGWVGIYAEGCCEGQFAIMQLWLAAAVE